MSGLSVMALRIGTSSVTTSQFTKTEGQYLAFIHYYSIIHRRPPAESDMQAYFRVTPPTVHDMIVRLHRKGLIDRKSSTPRSIHVLVPREDLPDLQE